MFDWDFSISWRNRRDDQETVLRRIKNDPQIAASILEGGSEGIRGRLRPFIVDDDDIAALLEQAELVVTQAPRGGPGELPTV